MKLLVMTGPFGTKSGYGEHARDIFYSLDKLNQFEIKLIDTPWGDTPRDFLDSNNKLHKSILEKIVDPNNPQAINRQPDVYVDCRIPNEFENPGKFNIGITAGVETNMVSANWLENCNKMDLIIVPSEHSKRGFIESKYDKMQNMPNGQKQKVAELRLEKPIEVLFEGANEDIYKPLSNSDENLEIVSSLDSIEEDFCFLFVGMWTSGGFGEDRKNISKTIKYFYESFGNQKKQPALILKTSGATHSILDREEILQKIESVKKMFPSFINLPKIYLLHGHLSDVEMNELYNHSKVKCLVSLTHGEGFGRPLLEATMTGLPVIASGWSGHLDFLDDKYSMLIGGELVDVPKSMHWENIIIPESKWFEVYDQPSCDILDFAYKNKYDIKQSAKKLMNINREKFTHKKMTEKLGEILNNTAINDIPEQVSLKLPELKKTKKTKIKLPKLKKLNVDKQPQGV